MEQHFKNSFKQKTRESLSMAVYSSGLQQCDNNFSWGPALRDHYLIHHVINGKGIYTVGKNAYEVNVGDSFIVYPNTIVSYRADKEEPWEYCWVGFNGSEAKLLIKQTPFSKTNPVIHFENSHSLSEAIVEIYSSSGVKAFSQTRMIGKLYVFLSILMEQSGSEDVKKDLSVLYLEGAIKYITYNFSQDIDVVSISKHIGISRSYLYRVFQNHLYESPTQYLIKFRINQACILLTQSNLSISHIANSVGYTDSLYFSRIFKSITGVSPSQYSKNNKQINE